MKTLLAKVAGTLRLMAMGGCGGPVPRQCPSSIRTGKPSGDAKLRGEEGSSLQCWDVADPVSIGGTELEEATGRLPWLPHCRYPGAV